MKTVYYWCPYISKVATVRSVLNSAESLKKYSKGEFQPVLLNVAGEWKEFEIEENKFNIKIINLTNSQILSNSNWTGFFKSRIIYIYIFIISFFPLLFFLKKNKPNFLIVHLISSLPLLVNCIFKLKTKIVLRISGLPKLNFLRNLFWKLALKKVSFITSPTIGTVSDLVNKFNSKRNIELLYDPIISPAEITKKSKEKIDDLKFENFFISIGRLTKQKNFIFLIDCIKEITKKYKEIKFLIIGEGELKEKINEKIKKNNLDNYVKLVPYKKNIYNYLMKSNGFILSSLWEDPGFVLVEAAYLNKPILSSDCKNGPSEILKYGKNGILFESNNKKSFLKKFDLFYNLDLKVKKKNIKNTKKYIKQFTSFSHYRKLISLLKKYD